MWVEYTDQPEAVRNIDGTITAARFFKVWGTSASAIITDPATVLQNATGGGGLPNYGEPHPSLSAVEGTSEPILTYYTVSQQGPVLLATAYYSNESSGTGLAMTFQRAIAKYPVLVRNRIVVAGLQPVITYEPSEKETPIPIGRLMLVRKFNRASFAGGSIDQLREAITSKINDLHAMSASPIEPPPEAPPAQTLPDDPDPQPSPGPQPNRSKRFSYFRFEGADIQSIGGAWIEAAYSWSYDPGIRPMGDAPPPTGLALLRPGQQPPQQGAQPTTPDVIYPLFESTLYPGEQYAVPPYQSIEVAANPNANPGDPNQFKFASAIEGYRPGHELDWLQLPGMSP